MRCCSGLAPRCRPLAAQLWHDAERLVPDRWPWVLRGARAEQQAGRYAEAAEGYQRYLAGASIDAPERAEALRWQGELPADLVEAAAAKVTGKPQPRSGGRLAGTVTLTAGVVLDVVAAGSWLWAHQIRSDVDAALAVKAADGHIIGITYEDAKRELARVDQRQTFAVAAGAVGLASTAVGLWLMLRDHDGVAVVPQANGLLLTGRF